jgi:membrane-associated phospholipid phosphatase
MSTSEPNAKTDLTQPRPLACYDVRLRVPKWLVWSTLIVVVSCSVSYGLLDLRVAEAFHGLDDATRKPVKLWANRITEAGKSSYYLYTLVPLVAVLWFTGARLWAAKIGLIAASIGAAGLAVNLLKMGFGRSRPAIWWEAGSWGFDPFKVGYDFSSFPSGHSSVVGALAMSLVFIQPRLWPLFALLGLVVGSTRVLTESHYISDVIAGLFFGALVAAALRRIWWNTNLWRKPRDLVL